MCPTWFRAPRRPARPPRTRLRLGALDDRTVPSVTLTAVSLGAPVNPVFVGPPDQVPALPGLPDLTTFPPHMGFQSVYQQAADGSWSLVEEAPADFEGAVQIFHTLDDAPVPPPVQLPGGDGTPVPGGESIVVRQDWAGRW